MNTEIYRIKAMIPYWDTDSSKPTEYSPYRIIEVYPTTVLSEFAQIILDSFEFMNPKPFGFYYNNINNYLFAKEGYVMRFEDEDEWNTFDPDGRYGDIDKGLVSDILIRRNKKWLLLFDYLKEWHIHVSLIDRYESDIQKKYPVVIEKHMKAPLQNESRY